MALAADELARLAERMHRAPDPEHTAEEVVAYARHELGADHAGITLIQRDGDLETVAPTDPLVEKVDRLQYDLGARAPKTTAVKPSAP